MHVDLLLSAYRPVPFRLINMPVGRKRALLGRTRRYLASGAAGEKDRSEARLWLERSLKQGVSEGEGDLMKLNEQLELQ